MKIRHLSGWALVISGFVACTGEDPVATAGAASGSVAVPGAPSGAMALAPAPTGTQPDPTDSTTVQLPSASGTTTPEGEDEPNTSPGLADAAADPGQTAEETTTVPDSSAPGEACPPACGPTTDEFYDNTKVATVRITIGEEALDGYEPQEWLQRLFDVRDQCEKEYLRSTFTYESPDGIGNVTLEDVGIRARGSMALSINEMKGFKLNFHKPFYEEANPGSTRRRFADINRLNTLSLEPAHSTDLEFDATRVFQCFTYQLMRDFDVLAPQCNHLRVYVNDEYYGLMQNVEESDHGRFLAHRFGSTEGMMVEASPSMSRCGYSDGDGNLKYEGDTMADYETPPRYALERGSAAEAEANLFPMFKCADSASTPNDDDYRACITDWLDVGEWLRLIAAESIIPELETLGYGRNINLYFQPDDSAPYGGRWLVSVWDLDATLNGQACSSASGGGLAGGGLAGGSSTTSACDPMTSISSLFGGSRLEFVTRLTSVFKAEYCEALDTFLEDVYSPSRLDEMASVMEPAMADDPVSTQQEWQVAIATTRQFMDSNGAAMRELIDAACN
jgi:spore coat protein CotH